MRKNVVKNIIKMVATAAMVIGIATTVKVDAQAAVTIEEFAAACNHTVAEVKADKELYDFYKYIKDDNLSDWLTGDSATTATATTATATTKTSATAKAGTVVNHKEMLDLVNADRKANGAGSLVWSDDLAVIAQQRAVEAMAAEQSAEMAAAIAAGDVKSQNAIAHKGARAGTGENELWISDSIGETAELQNDAWIASAGHHRQRIKAGWTQYAAASYICPTTGQMVWVEVFADNSFKGASSFDYIRYAKDYPDLAAAFGQNKNALYNHYITYGVYEGRKAYYTDGTLFKK